MSSVALKQWPQRMWEGQSAAVFKRNMKMQDTDVMLLLLQLPMSHFNTPVQ